MKKIYTPANRFPVFHFDCIRRYRHLLWTLLLVILASTTHGQDYNATKEKIYIHTNHVFFQPGDILYFKAYVVRAEDQKPTVISNVLYAELISPAGTVVRKSHFGINNGYAEGSFDFSTQAPGGIYKIRAFTSWMQNETENTFFIKEVTLQQSLAPRVLMKLDFPEKGYGAGDEVKAEFSMRNLNDLPIRNHEGKYAVSVGGEVISTSSFKTDAGGKSVIRFSLPKELTTNDGLLNITVMYDSYTESISRSIPIVLNKIDLQFMPEGGTLVEDITSYIAFKALNENGKAADIKGEIRDKQGNKVAVFESYHFGMGKFTLTPASGQCYKAFITSPSNIRQEFELPLAAAQGVTMQVYKEKKELVVILNASSDKDIKLKVSSRNTIYHLENIKLSKGRNEISLDENIFPAGIAQVSLLNADELPLAERLVFLNEDRRLRVIVTPSKGKYLPREKVSLTLKTLDENGRPIPSNFSLAVVDDKLWTFADDKQDHILSWLLLCSELKGKIEEPQFYFKTGEPKAVTALDLLMLTHGYRYFDYIEYVVKEGSLKFLPDQDHILSGQILNEDKLPVRADLFLVNVLAGGEAMHIKTNEDGMFFFSDLKQASQYYLFAQSLEKKEKISINILQNGLGYNPVKAKELKLLPSKPAEKAWALPKIIQKEERKQLPGVVMEPGKNVAMSEVVVTAMGQYRQRKELGYSVSFLRAADLTQAKLANAMHGRVAGLNIVQNANVFDNSKVTLRGIRSMAGENQPLYVLNGIPMDHLSLNGFLSSDIESITVVKDAVATALFGSRAANGAIIVDLKKYRRERIRFNLDAKYFYVSQQIFTPAGTVLHVAKKFYIPKYATLSTEERTDFRETIYWNPVVQTDRDGNASVEFYNSDASTTFRVIAEGIGYNGNLGREEATYAVQNALQVDVKIPPYLTVGDKALLPLVIKNNSGTKQQFTISSIVPPEFKVGQFNNKVSIDPEGSHRILVPVEAVSAGSGNIQFKVMGASGQETISLPIKAADKGFPVKLTFSGNRSAEHNFNIGQMIPGTLQTSLRLFKNLEGQLLDGIESMLREPYGCFEQTSSATYPNILVLKYLKESGRANPQLEKRALEYIDRGYKRLIGFETKEDGFEWFGRTPPHEALTAYGLLEFTDMQDFISVDKAMLERTKRFLLGRRDGKGTFKLETRGLDQFASVPGNIANTYIVYALTQAGVGNEIRKEYETAVKKAMESKDGYQLAMMAIAAHKMKDIVLYKQLLELLNDDKLQAETSVVNSRGASLRVETNALYAMALMNASSPDMGKVAVLISKILSEKSYYGYGSTQSTVLALQAIVEYSKLVGRINSDSPVSFSINNKNVTHETALSQLKEGGNSFSVTYPQKDKAIPYNLEVSYSTYTPPNSEKAELLINTIVKVKNAKMGETVRMDIEVTNTKDKLQPMAIAKVGIPAGLSVQPWQLKEIMEKNQAAYYEVFDNYLVFYWMGFAPVETKKISLDLKADVPGLYKAKASTVYLYYTPEYKNWVDGAEMEIKE